MIDSNGREMRTDMSYIKLFPYVFFDDFVYTFRPHLVVDILNFDPFVTCVTDIDATVKLRRRLY